MQRAKDTPYASRFNIERIQEIGQLRDAPPGGWWADCPRADV